MVPEVAVAGLEVLALMAHQEVSAGLGPPRRFPDLLSPTQAAAVRLEAARLAALAAAGLETQAATRLLVRLIVVAAVVVPTTDLGATEVPASSSCRSPRPIPRPSRAA